MAFKFVVLATLLVCANAGIIGEPAIAAYSAAPAVSSSYIHQAPLAVAHAAPIGYAAPSVAIQSPTYGSTHQSVERSLGGAQSVSHYSKAIDSAFSSVRKYDTRITNDALTPIATYAAPAQVATYATKTYAAAPALAYSSAPLVSHSFIHQAQPLLAKAVGPVATYAHAPVTTYAHAPVATYAHAPVATYAHAPVATYAAHAPVATYAAHAPVATYAAHAPVATYAAPGPLVTKAISSPYAYAAQSPVVAKAALAYSPATVVAHTTFTGLGTAYQW